MEGPLPNPLAEWVRRSLVQGVQAGLADLAQAALSPPSAVGPAMIPVPEPTPEPLPSPKARRKRKPGPKPGDWKAEESEDSPPLSGGRGEKTRQQRRAVARVLSKRGRTPVMDVARECNIPSGSISSVLAHHWFDKSPEGVVLTAMGREEFFDDDD